MGISCSAIEKYSEALKWYGKAVKINGKNDISYFNMGNVYFAMKEFVNAEIFYGKAIELQPKIAFYYLNKGAAL